MQHNNVDRIKLRLQTTKHSFVITYIGAIEVYYCLCLWKSVIEAAASNHKELAYNLLGAQK